MSSKTKVTVTTESYPEAALSWEVNLVPPGQEPDPAAILLYNNLCYDLVGIVIAKLGVEYSKWLLEGDTGNFGEAQAKIQAAVLGN